MSTPDDLRTLFAALAMVGLIIRLNDQELQRGGAEHVARSALLFADALLKALGKEE